MVLAYHNDPNGFGKKYGSDSEKILQQTLAQVQIQRWANEHMQVRTYSPYLGMTPTPYPGMNPSQEIWDSFWRGAGATATIVGGGLEVYGGALAVQVAPVAGMGLIMHGTTNIAIGSAELVFTIVDYPVDAQRLVLGDYGSGAWDLSNAVLGYREGRILTRTGRHFEGYASYLDATYSLYQGVTTLFNE